MKLKERIEHFATLGNRIDQLLADSDRFNTLAEQAFVKNNWFTRSNVRFALEQTSGLLAQETLEDWVSNYEFKESEPTRVGVIMAGNIPMVGFHDMLCVLICGHSFVGRLSADDDVLLPWLIQELITIGPDFDQRIDIAQDKLEGIDAVIATGSNNTARYFEYYFGKYPNIIRKHRNAIAVLDGTETNSELQQFGDDIFSYFGLGCRSVSKLFVPKGYEFDDLFKGLFSHGEVLDHAKYANNYEYNRTIYLMNQEELLDNNFVLLKEDIAIASPVGTLYYEQYESPDQLHERLDMDAANIQCRVGHAYLPFGSAQKPGLTDYSDGIDTVEFLLQL